jgi:integrase
VVRQWAEEEESRVRTLKKRASSLATDLQRLHAVLGFLGGYDISHIDERRLVAYQEHRLAMRRKPNTINGELRSLRVVLGWAKKRGLINDVPTAEAIPILRREVAVPTPMEMARIIVHLAPNLAFLVRFLAETGVRKGEAFYLTWADVDEVNGIVAIRSKEGWTPKTQHSERRIFLSPGLLNQLRSQPKLSQWVFPSREPSKPITRFDDALAAAVRAAGVLRNGNPIHLTPHVLRKANATWQAMRGVVPSVLQSMLGHAPGSKVTERHYIQAVEETVRQSVLELPLDDALATSLVLTERRD